MKLAGIAIIIIGLFLRWRTGPVVLAAGLVTALLAGMPLVGAPTSPGVLDVLGKAFIDGRAISLFLITLPAIGLVEKHGLHFQAAAVIRKLAFATPGRLLWAFQAIRVGIGAVGLRISGHAIFGRPLIVPMALGLLPAPTEDQAEQVKSAAGASENYGNFFGQNLFPANSGCLLIQQILKNAGYSVDLVRIAVLAIPIVVMSLVLSAVQFFLLERALAKTSSTKSSP